MLYLKKAVLRNCFFLLLTNVHINILGKFVRFNTENHEENFHIDYSCSNGSCCTFQLLQQAGRL